MENMPVDRLLILAFGVAVLLFTLRRMLSRKSAPRVGTFEDINREKQVKEQLDDLLIRIQEVSREQIAKLDTKMRILNQLVIDAEQKKRELEALLQGSTAARPTPEPAAKPNPAPPPRPANPLHQRVYELQDQGKNLAEIGSATGLEKGEIELVLGLRKMK